MGPLCFLGTQKVGSLPTGSRVNGKGSLLFSLGTNLMKADLGNIQGEGCPQKRTRWFFSAISNASLPPIPRTALTRVHSTEMSKLMMEKARRHSDLEEGHHQPNGGGNNSPPPERVH